MVCSDTCSDSNCSDICRGSWLSSFPFCVWELCVFAVYLGLRGWELHSIHFFVWESELRVSWTYAHFFNVLYHNVFPGWLCLLLSWDGAHPPTFRTGPKSIASNREGQCRFITPLSFMPYLLPPSKRKVNIPTSSTSPYSRGLIRFSVFCQFSSSVSGVRGCQEFPIFILGFHLLKFLAWGCVFLLVWLLIVNFCWILIYLFPKSSARDITRGSMASPKEQRFCSLSDQLWDPESL